MKNDAAWLLRSHSIDEKGYLHLRIAKSLKEYA
jgi:hypothetical protein